MQEGSDASMETLMKAGLLRQNCNLDKLETCSSMKESQHNCDTVIADVVNIFSTRMAKPPPQNADAKTYCIQVQP